MSAEPAGAAVDRIMSISETEFAASLAALLGPLRPEECRGLTRRLGSGEVTIAFEPLEPVRLGGLLELPQARVRLQFSGVSERERKQFLRAFEIAFQRGGG